MPRDTKNRAAKVSLRGTTSDRARWPKSVSLSSNPATNAPKAADSPKLSVAAAETKVIATPVTMKISLDPKLVIRPNSQGMPLLPRTAIRASKTPALRSPNPKSVKKSPPLNAGSSAIMGTKARS